MKQFLLIVLLLAAAMVAAHAESVPVTVSQARIRWLPGDLPMAGYFRITSHATNPLYLIGATSPAFGELMLHRSVEEGGTSRMETVARITLNPSQTVEFSPGGYHLMLMQRKQEVHAGQEVPVTLRFSDGETLTARFKVVGVQGQ